MAAVRLVMLEGVDDEGNPTGEAPKPAGSALLPVLGLLGITLARAAGYLTLNDPLTRALLFVPLFTYLVMTLHRQTLQGSKGLSGFLSHPFFTYLGKISFPIFIVHGALGQLFYKKIVATKVGLGGWGGGAGRAGPGLFYKKDCCHQELRVSHVAGMGVWVGSDGGSCGVGQGTVWWGRLASKACGPNVCSVQCAWARESGVLSPALPCQGRHQLVAAASQS